MVCFHFWAGWQHCSILVSQSVDNHSLLSRESAVQYKRHQQWTVHMGRTARQSGDFDVLYLHEVNPNWIFQKPTDRQWEDSKWSRSSGGVFKRVHQTYMTFLFPLLVTVLPAVSLSRQARFRRPLLERLERQRRSLCASTPSRLRSVGAHGEPNAW